MKIREFRHLDELNRLPRDYVQIDKNTNPHPEPFKKRLVAFLIGIVSIFLIVWLLAYMFSAVFH